MRKFQKIVLFCFTVFVIYDILLSIYQLVSAAALLFGFLINNIIDEQIEKTIFQFDKRGIFLLIKTHCSGLCSPF